jgi:tetratricopeptide (TPR) repeat protein
LNPRSAQAHWKIGRSLSDLGRTKEAIDHYRQALQLRRAWPEVMNRLAWILATHDNSELRDGIEAVLLAERACSLTDRRVPAYLATLAAAYAEAARFDEAVKTAEETIELAQAAGQEELAEDTRNRLELYKKRSTNH